MSEQNPDPSQAEDERAFIQARQARMRREADERAAAMSVEDRSQESD